MVSLESPIAQMVRLAGEPVRLTAPVASASYNPHLTTPTGVQTPAVVDTRGIPAAPEEILAQGALDGVTILPASLPAGFGPQTATVTWRGEPAWRVIKVRNRYWRGALSGYTLFLAA